MRGLSTRAGVALLTLLYLVLASSAVLDDRFLHDEGLLLHLLGELVGREPWATVFLQKARPPVALLYAPVAGAGLGVFLWLHVLVCAAAVPLCALAAHRLGQARPEVAAAVVALSPMYIGAGAAGLMNADAVVGVALVAALWAGGRALAAALVLGTLVWVRAELALLALTMLGWALWTRRLRVVLGLAGFALVYGVAGAVYHQDLGWMLRFPPALPQPMADNPYWAQHEGDAVLPTVVLAVLSISPAVVLAGLWRSHRAPVVERLGVLFAMVFVAALVLLPQWRVFNFDLSPRYLLPVLPWLALAVGRVVDDVGPGADATGGMRRALGLGLIAGLAIAAERWGAGATALVAVGMGAAMTALAGADRPLAARALLGALLVGGPLAFGAGARLARRQQASSLDAMVEHLREHPEWSAQPLYTNEPLLAAYLERGGALPGRDVRYLVQADQLHELTTLSNPDNGQRAAILSALRQGFYGVPVFPDELSPEAVPEGAVFVLRDDPRLAQVMPQQRWAPWLWVRHADVGVTIAQRIEPGSMP